MRVSRPDTARSISNMLSRGGPRLSFSGGFSIRNVLAEHWHTSYSCPKTFAPFFSMPFRVTRPCGTQTNGQSDRHAKPVIRPTVLSEFVQISFIFCEFFTTIVILMCFSVIPKTEKKEVYSPYHPNNKNIIYLFNSNKLTTRDTTR